VQFEDPAPELQRLRDRLDLQRAQALEWLNAQAASQVQTRVACFSRHPSRGPWGRFKARALAAQHTEAPVHGHAAHACAGNVLRRHEERGACATLLDAVECAVQGRRCHQTFACRTFVLPRISWVAACQES
jgi:hypothetical protein